MCGKQMRGWIHSHFCRPNGRERGRGRERQEGSEESLEKQRRRERRRGGIAFAKSVTIARDSGRGEEGGEEGGGGSSTIKTNSIHHPITRAHPIGQRAINPLSSFELQKGRRR